MLVSKTACVLATLFAYSLVNLSPLPELRQNASSCESGCAVWEDLVFSGSVTISGGIGDVTTGNGKCECEGEICKKVEPCNLTTTYTFDAGTKWLCNGTTSYGHTEDVVLTVSQCGDVKFSMTFWGSDTSACTGFADGQGYANLNCELCSERNLYCQ